MNLTVPVPFQKIPNLYFPEELWLWPLIFDSLEESPLARLNFFDSFVLGVVIQGVIFRDKSTSRAASGIGVPGPKIHDTPRLFRKS